MIKILITGKNSYVGKNLSKWLEKSPDRYSVDLVSLRDDSWKDIDFSKYEVVVHMAGIAHIKETKENAHLYYKINRDLAYEVAQQAKFKGVNQFVFLSSMSIYGIESGIIDKDTRPKPRSYYGGSKFEAEGLLKSLDDRDFNLAIIRPPIIYGKGCKGNYPKLAKLALKMPFFPDIENNRSMLYIDNLSEFLRLIIENKNKGIFFPQNREYVNTSDLVKLITKVHGKRIWLTKRFNPIIYYFCNKISVLNKVFGSLVYDKSLSIYTDDYNISSFSNSIKITEKSLK